MPLEFHKMIVTGKNLRHLTLKTLVISVKCIHVWSTLAVIGQFDPPDCPSDSVGKTAGTVKGSGADFGFLIDHSGCY